MSDRDHCPACGAPLLPSGAGATVCPRCAFGLALAGRAGPSERGPEPDAAATHDAGSGTVDPGDAAGDAPGRRLGPYRLRRVVGEGGMGVVWEAQQEEPVRRRVALKRIRPGMDSAQVLSRFAQERQALALMSHPGIAQVYDAGRTSDGRPYFAMEFVDGPWITHYSDARRLTVAERLRLFLQVCAGVQHAHHKGVIHRDLKPSNVLVPVEGDEPVPKIIDFGVAKAMGADLAAPTLVTRIGQQVGTPEYMSPEQAGPAGFDLDTRSDVYALGVLLFELCTGAPPFVAEGGDLDDLRRRIREDDPPRPSERLAALGAEGVEVARRRSTDPAGLARALRGDLDWIALRALAKDRARRYGSPDDLAADLRRHLAHEPVQAGPPGAAYRLSKFARRHRLGVAAAGAVLTLLVATAIGMTLQARRVARERDRANRAAETAGAALAFLTDTFRLSDPEQARGETITAREILDRGAARIETSLGDTPEAQAALLLTMGETYANLGLFDRAEPLVRRAVDRRRAILGPGDAGTCAAMVQLADVLRQRESFAEAEALARQALAGLEKISGADAAEAGSARLVLGETLVGTGHLQEAEPILSQAREELVRRLGSDARVTLRATTALADCLSRRARYDEADALYRAALESQRRVSGRDDPNAVVTLNGLAINARLAGRNAEAESLFREGLETLRRVDGNDHPSTLTACHNLAVFLTEIGDYEEAAPLIQEALAGRRRVFGAKSVAALGSLTDWATLERNRGHLAVSEQAFREALDGFQATLGPDHPQTMRASNNLGSLLRLMGRLREAEPYYRASFEAAVRVLGPEHPNTLTAQSNLGEVLALEGRFVEAEPLLTSAVTSMRKVLPPGHGNIGLGLRKYGLCLTRMRRFTEAEAALLEANDLVRAAYGPSHALTKAVAHDLAALYDAWGKGQEAARWRAAERAG